MTKSLSKLVWAFLAISFLASCTSVKKREPASLTKVDDKISVASIWSTGVGKSDTFVMRPVLAGDYLYTSAGNGTVSKIEVLTGKVTWQVKAPSDISSGPGSDGNVVVVAELWRLSNGGGLAMAAVVQWWW
jgi:outer membrane protein assembly factor BamB